MTAIRTCPVKGYNRRVLLEFDGIVFRNAAVSRQIAQRSKEWVNQCMHYMNPPITPRSHVAYNNFDYVINFMINQHNLKELRPFYEYVYDGLEDTDKLITSQDKQHIQDLLVIRDARDLEFVLCSNAPQEYCERILSAQGLHFTDFFNSAMVFTPNTVDAMKPSKEFYDKIEEYLPDELSIHHLDDDPYTVWSTESRETPTIWASHSLASYKQVVEHLISFPIRQTDNDCKA